MKKVNVLHEATGIKFGYNGRNIIISETMPIEDAEHIQAIHPGGYVEVIEVADEPTETTPAKKAKTATSAE